MPPPRHFLPVLRYGSGSGSPPKFNHLFIGQLKTFAENFMQIRSNVLRKVANRQTNRQTNKQRRLHILLCGGNKNWYPSVFRRTRNISYISYRIVYWCTFSLVFILSPSRNSKYNIKADSCVRL